MKKNQRQLQKTQTRKHLIETAFKILAENGLTTTRTADIAKAANVSHGTVFVHFSTQDILLSAVIEEFGSQITQRLHELASSSTGVREILKAHLKGLAEFEPFYTRLVVENRLLPEKARLTYIMIQSAISFHLIQAVERDVKYGTIRPIPVHLLFNTWIGLVHHYLTNNDLFAPEASVLQRYGNELLEHFMNLITKDTELKP